MVSVNQWYYDRMYIVQLTIYFLLNYSFLEQMIDIFPSLMLAIGMGIVAYLIGFLPAPTLPLLILQVIISAIVFIVGSRVFRLEPYIYLLGTIKSMINKEKKV